MLRLLGDIIFGIGRLIGGIKYKLGFVRRVPDKFRSHLGDF
jgi:hypothetical protein